jgi:hypothetical protein
MTKAIKSGYGKYIWIDKKNELIGRPDAVGPSEKFDPILDVRLTIDF